MIWKTAEHDEAIVSRIMDRFRLPRVVATTLAIRNVIEEDEVDAYLKPRLSNLSDPYDLPGMEAAVERIWQAIDKGEKIVVYGDYDVDGITSTALFVTVLRELGAEVDSFLPHRVVDGYGLAVDTVEKCVEKFGP
ncbi:MAG: DHH family phosphoesterase, partial [Verrucomicrobiota bacterium]